MTRCQRCRRFTSDGDLCAQGVGCNQIPPFHVRQTIFSLVEAGLYLHRWTKRGRPRDDHEIEAIALGALLLLYLRRHEGRS